MEIMKPPPIGSTIEEPSQEMKPPRIEINSPGNGIFRVPNSKDSSVELQHVKPYVPRPSVEMIPPVKIAHDEEVLGMSPPPPVTTHLPILNFNATTNKPVFSLEVDIPESQRYPVLEISTTTEVIKVTRNRRPYTRRPTIRRTNKFRHRTTTSGVVNRNSTTPGSLNNIDAGFVSGSETHTTGIAAVPKIKPTASLKVPTMEVIIGRPQINDQSKKEVPTTEVNEEQATKIGDKIQIESSEISWLEKEGSKSTEVLSNVATTDRFGDFTAGVHHSGNEIKIIDDSSGSQNKDTKLLIPTKYVTHTKTHTITITKTTVVKTLGGPPSTMTILVTKTEKSTVVDTVTEFHTLLKPTNIVETVTTTIKPSSLYPPNLAYGGHYTHIKSTPIINGEMPSTPILSLDDDLDEDSLEEFIISDTDPPMTSMENNTGYQDGNSIFVVMTDKKGGGVVKIPSGKGSSEESYETQNRDEMLSNNEQVNRVLLGGILIAQPPSLETPEVLMSGKEKCVPECKASRNELCQAAEGLMRCVCRPGFARMFPDRPCKRKWIIYFKLKHQ